MARIDEMTEKSIERVSRHKPVSATFSIYELDGKPVLQIDTYGSPDRQLPGKASQSVQFEEAGIAALKNLLDRL